MKCLCGCGAALPPGRRYVRFHHLRVKTEAHIEKLRAMLPRARAAIDPAKMEAARAAANARRWADPKQKQIASKRWRGSDNPLWNHEGRKLNKSGRVFVRIDGQWRAESRVIAERALGRPLAAGEVVHHWNEKKDDNRNDNLLVCTDSYHRALHRRMLKLSNRGITFWREA